MKTLIKRTTGIRARIPDENHDDADSEELMIDAAGEGPRRSLRMSRPRYSRLAPLLCDERTYVLHEHTPDPCSELWTATWLAFVVHDLLRRLINALQSDRSHEKRCPRKRGILSWDSLSANLRDSELRLQRVTSKENKLSFQRSYEIFSKMSLFYSALAIR